MFFSHNCNCGDSTPTENNAISKKFNGRYHIVRYNTDDKGVVQKTYDTRIRVAHNPVYEVLMSAQPIDETTELGDVVTENDTTTITGTENERLQLRGMFTICGATPKTVNTSAPPNDYANGVFWLGTQNLEVDIKYKLYVMCNILTVPYTNTIQFYLNAAGGNDQSYTASVNTAGYQVLEIEFTNRVNSAYSVRRSFSVCLNGCSMDIFGLFYAKADDVSPYNYVGTSAELKITEKDVVFSDDATNFELSYNVPIERAIPVVQYQNINPRVVGSVNNDDFNDFYSYYKFCLMGSDDEYTLTEAMLGLRTIGGGVVFKTDRDKNKIILMLPSGNFLIPGDVIRIDIVFLY